MAKGRISQQELKRDPLMEQYINTTTWVKGRTQPILKWGTIIAVLLVVAAIVWIFISRRESNAREALAEAFRYHDAMVANPIPAGVKKIVFTTDEEKDRKSYEFFTKAANDYPSFNGEIGRFYAAMHQLKFEPEKAEVTLRDLAQKDNDIGAQARFALASRFEAVGKFDEAIAEYKKLREKPLNLPTQVIDCNIANIYEKQGKTQEAIDLYFGVANNPEWRSAQVGVRAGNRLSILSPEKFAMLPEQKESNMFGGASMIQ